MTDPTPPKNVRLVMPDGTEFGCEVYYLGIDSEGLHKWRVTGNMAALLRGAHVKVEVLPPMTSLMLDMEMEG